MEHGPSEGDSAVMDKYTMFLFMQIIKGVEKENVVNGGPVKPMHCLL